MCNVTVFPAPCLIMPDNLSDTDSYRALFAVSVEFSCLCICLSVFLCLCVHLYAGLQELLQAMPRIMHPWHAFLSQVTQAAKPIHDDPFEKAVAAGGELPAYIPEDWRNMVQCCQAANPQDRPTVPELLAMLSLLQHAPPAYDLSGPSTLARPAVISSDAAATDSSRPALAGADYRLSTFSCIDKELSHDKATTHSLGNFFTPLDKPDTLTFELHCTSTMQMAESLPNASIWGKALPREETLDQNMIPAEPALLFPSRGTAGKQATLCFVWQLLYCH